MPLPELTKRKVEKILTDYCDRLVPPSIRHQLMLKFAFRGQTVSLYEERPVWNDPTRKTQVSVAQFRFTLKSKEWALYWRDRNCRWHLYDRFPSGRVFEELLKEVDRDPTGIFWG